MKKLTPFVILALASVANAQSFSSFANANFNGVHIQSTDLGGGLYKFRVHLNLAPVVDLGAGPKAITNAFGFYLLDDGGNVKNYTASATPIPTSWTYDEKTDYAGYEDNDKSNLILPNVAANPNAQDKTFYFQFSNASDFSKITHYGLHVSATGAFTGPTGFVKGVVPEPASMSAMAIGLLALARRRFKK